ncbi:diacylglycerol/lipid kinase family protein [Pseudooceanicola sp. C21-150M6]|uniref:diacylglycerol/lipid kinase family protein n=1 Tax=Pseudooceanicola sp. C21-150M6 TaxID=3434355 RepID=UPI003D7FAE7D
MNIQSQSGHRQATRGATRSICIIANPVSGKEDTGLFPRLEHVLTELGGRHELRVAESGGQLESLAEHAVGDRFDVIAAAGGDGTIAAVTSALFHARKGAGSDLPHLGVIPLGTFNYVAREYGLPQDDPEAALRLLATAPARPISVGTVNGRVFLNNASLGAYPAILDQREGIYRRWGRSRIAAYWSVLQVLASLPSPLSMTIDIDGEQRRKKSPLAFVANSAYQIREFDLPGAEEVEEGRFAIYMAPDTGRYGLILRALRLAGRIARPGRDMELMHGRTVTIATRQKKRLVARDGEKTEMKSPFTFELHKDALTLVAPDQTATE